MKKLSLGCDLGSASVKVAVLDADNVCVASRYRMHRGNVLSTFYEMKDEIIAEFGDQIAWAMVAGSMSRSFPSHYRANEIAAVVAGARHIFPGVASIVDIGGESARYIADVDKDQVNFSLNCSCSAGTGSFFEDQMTRLGTRLDEYSELADKATSTPRIAGRCTVFAKTDIVHRQQEGATTPDILRGLAFAMVRNFKGTIVRNLGIREPLVLSGGVAKNSAVRAALQEILKIDTLHYAEESPCIMAIGCAALARTQAVGFEEETFHPAPLPASVSSLAPLTKELETHHLYELYPLKQGEPVYLGVDIGSTSTNLVLVNGDGEVVDFQYLRTSGEPLAVAERGIKNIYRRFGDSLVIKAIGTTGSGRYMVGKELGALVVRDEITAQARGAKANLPEVDTIFEIGGQDSKFIRLSAGQVIDFQMNKVCAAGTGSFVEEQAKRLEISLDEFGPLALSGEKPAELGERCTVFIKSQVEKVMGEGVDKSSVAAGICYSIVHNYLHKVVGNKPIGDNICLSGGLGYNDGIIAAFRHYYPQMQVTPYFFVTGALGIALIARDETLKDQQNILPAVLPATIEHNTRLYHASEKYFIGNYDGVLDPSRKTVGIPRALMVYKMFPMAYNFFTSLGFNVLLSPETDEDIIRRSQELVEEETCYPVKLILGHFSWLIEQQCDAIFMPSVYTMRHASSTLSNNYGCVYMQNVASRFGERLGLAEKGIEFLNPVLEMDMGAPELAKAMITIGTRLGRSKVRCLAAMVTGGAALKRFSRKSEELGKEILDGLKSGEKALVLITRNYGIEDAVLSMGVADELLQRGYKVITPSHLDAHTTDLSREYPNLYWPFGQHILTGMKIVRDDPRLFAVYLTNHGCGPDTMLAHLSAEIMGDKPWLTLEVDEHYSPVGLVTRVEAFLSSLAAHGTGTEGKRPADPDFSNRFVVGNFTELTKDRPVFLPHLFPYSSLRAARLQNEGLDCRELPPTDMASLTLGRAETRTKEYVTFTAMLGDVLKCRKAHTEPHQLVLLQNGGSEADGLFSRTIRSVLDTMGNTHTTIFSPLLEDLHGDEAFWLDVLAGDVVMAAPKEERDGLLKQFAEDGSWDMVLSVAGRIGKGSEAKPVILLQGDPACVFNPQVNGYLFDNLDEEYRVSRLPLSEYLLFFWRDNGVEISRRQQQLQELHNALGSFSPFSESLDALQAVADKKIGRLAGGNGRYRLAKSILATASAVGIIETAPLYENVASLLNLSVPETDGIPLLRLLVNGEGKEREKLETFLHFLKSRKKRPQKAGTSSIQPALCS